MDFRILGPLEVFDDEREVAPRRAKQRALLALLLLHANQVMTSDRLIDALWGAEPPDTADKALQGHVSALRKLLGQDRIRTEHGGYRLELRPGELDLDRFEGAVRAGRSLADPGERAARLAGALASWRGDPLADLRYEPFALAEIERLDELRLGAIEERIDADLATGRHPEVLPELERLVAGHPLRERLREQQVLALYRCGRQADALRAYQATRRLLSEELGIDPGPALRLLEQRILAHDPGLEPPSKEAPHNVRQERKTVTVVVLEIAGFGQVDPEDLDALVAPARARVEDVIRRFGGAVQPLFANAVLGIFGAARAHEDDPERAVRAALAASEVLAALSLQVSAAVESGNALVTMAGDRVDLTGEVLSAANRLHVAASGDEVLVSDAIRRATDDSIDYVEHRGGAWRAIALRRTPVDRRFESSPATFIGREDELAMLEAAFARARRMGRSQLATIVGEPGAGKTRLVRELRSRLEARGEPHAWREGRCLPYGEGVTYWALGEIVKAEAGILETTGADDARALLVAALERLVEDADTRAWLVASLAPLVGIAGESEGDPGRSAAAAREFLQRIASRQPLVVVFEDLHWADPALVDFVDDLAARVIGPMLVVCTTRHEFIDTRPSWAAGARDAVSITLPPLPESDISALLTELLGQAPLPEAVRRAGGNPLFAHELARRLLAGGPNPAQLPEHIQAVIASRLDAMPTELRETAASAAVVGEVFWPGAIVAIDGLAPAEADRRMRGLVARDVIRPVRRSTVLGTEEYSFLHALVRDAAYERIPRAERARRHLAAADWIEGLAGDRTIDHAEFLAYHCVAALDLIGSSASSEAAAELRARTARFLVLAGDRAMRLDVAAAERFYERALALLDPGHQDRPAVLVRVADAAQEANRLRDAVARYEEALAALEPAGDQLDVARAMNGLARAYWRLGDTKRHDVVLDDAIARLAGLSIGPELVRLWGQKARGLVLDGRASEALPWIDRAASSAQPEQAPEVRMRMLMYGDVARLELGQPVTFADTREAIRLGHELGLGYETAVAYANLADSLAKEEGPAAGLEIVRTAIAFAEQRGLSHMVARARWGVGLQLRVEMGAWDEALAEADALQRAERGEGLTQLAAVALKEKTEVLVSRGLIAEAEAIVGDLLPTSRRIGNLQMLAPALAAAARFERDRGHISAAIELIEELEVATRNNAAWRSYVVADAVRVCVNVPDLALAARFVAGTTTVPRRNRGMVLAARGALAEAKRELDEALRLHSEAAELWGSFGHVAEHGQALLGRGRCLVLLGRPGEAPEALGAARAIFAGLGARPLLDETERWIQRTQAE